MNSLSSDVQWGPGIIVLVVGAVFGAIILFMIRRNAKPISEAEDRLADLNRKLQTLLEQLRELHTEEHLLSDTAFATEKARLEKEAAEALRARDEYAQAITRANEMTDAATGKKEAAPAAPPPGFLAANPQLKGALWGAGIVGFFVLLGLLLTQESKPREESMGAPPMTGGGAPMANKQSAAQQAEEREFQELEQKLKANPDDVELSARVVHEMLRRQDFTNASALTERALTQDPFHTESRIHREVLRGLKGDAMGSLEALEKIGAAQPDGEEALLFAGALAMEVEDPRRALTDFERYAATARPEDQPPQLMQGIALLRQQVAAMDGKAPQAVPGPDMPKQDQNVRPPQLTQEQMQAFEQMQQNPEFVKAAQGNIEKAEEDLAAGRFQDALDKYKQVMPVMPGNTRAQAGMAWALHGLNRQPMADNIWNVAAKDPAALDALGDSLKAKGDANGAKQLWAKLAETVPGYGPVKDKLR